MVGWVSGEQEQARPGLLSYTLCRYTYVPSWLAVMKIENRRMHTAVALASFFSGWKLYQLRQKDCNNTSLDRGLELIGLLRWHNKFIQTCLWPSVVTTLLYPLWHIWLAICVCMRLVYTYPQTSKGSLRKIRTVLTRESTNRAAVFLKLRYVRTSIPSILTTLVSARSGRNLI